MKISIQKLLHMGKLAPGNLHFPCRGHPEKFLHQKHAEHAIDYLCALTFIWWKPHSNVSIGASLLEQLGHEGNINGYINEINALTIWTPESSVLIFFYHVRLVSHVQHRDPSLGLDHASTLILYFQPPTSEQKYIPVIYALCHTLLWYPKLTKTAQKLPQRTKYCPLGRPKCLPGTQEPAWPHTPVCWSLLQMTFEPGLRWFKRLVSLRHCLHWQY